MAARRKRNKYYQFTFKNKHVRLLLDRVLLFRYLKRVQGRFWGVTAISGMIIGFSICFAIRPDLVHISTAFSDFANDVRTAPYFAGSVFFAAYGMWRWRIYLSHTWKRTMPVTGLITLTILGLYLVALMPISWKPIPYYLHLFGVGLAGTSMLATVVLDGLLSHSRKSSKAATWKTLRYVSFFSIIIGGWLTFESTEIRARYNVSLLGESLLLAGYFIWIIIKTYQGQGRRTLLSKFLKDFVLID
jgi:hypothetical protein